MWTLWRTAGMHILEALSSEELTAEGKIKRDIKINDGEDRRGSKCLSFVWLRLVTLTNMSHALSSAKQSSKVCSH